MEGPPDLLTHFAETAEFAKLQEEQEAAHGHPQPQNHGQPIAQPVSIGSLNDSQLQSPSPSQSASQLSPGEESPGMDGSGDRKRKRGRPRKPLDNSMEVEEAVEIVESRDFDEMYNELLQYKQQHGNTNVPQTQGDLGSWVVNIRTLYKKGRLAPEKSQKLNDSGFVWARHGDWDDMYEQLKQFKAEHNSTNVPQRSGRLGYWVNNMRQYYKKGKLSADRIKKLNDLGFVWQQYSVHSWEEMYEQLKQYKEQQAHTNVPQKSGRLGQWVNEMRAQRREGRLTEDRVQKLDELGFNWITKHRDPTVTTTKATWEHYLQQLMAFRDEHGHCNVKRRDGRLGGWVHDQRQAYKKGKLTDDKVMKLEAIGFVWSMIDTPADQLAALHGEELQLLREIIHFLGPLPDVLERDVYIEEEEEEEEFIFESLFEEKNEEDNLTREEAEEILRHIEALANLNAVTRLLSTQLNSVPFSDPSVHGGIGTLGLIGQPQLHHSSIVPTEDPNETVLAIGNVQNSIHAPAMSHSMSLQHIVNSELQHNK